MKLAKFWSRDTAEYQGLRTSARGWSDDSFEAAKAKAREIAHRVAERVINHPNEKERYPYGDRPLPEPILKQFAGGAAAVTRNVYGSLIMNTDEMMFIDIDRDEGKPPNIDVQGIAARHGLSGRFYQTFAGYRVILTDRKFVPGSPDSEALLTEFGADKMYARLCKMQLSFRARLTPKPWRCNFYKPYIRYPFENPHDQRIMNEWVAKYDEKARPYATCKLVSSFGMNVIAGFGELLVYHDNETKALSALPLA
jgi:hypothetical protein